MSVPVPLRSMAAPFVVSEACGVSVRTRLNDLTAADEMVLRRVGAHLGSLASRDLKARCADGLGHSAQRWAERKRELTGLSSSRWAGAITKASHDQWALARRSQTAHITTLDAAITTISHRLALPVGQKSARGVPGGYRSAKEWFGKSRRLTVLKQRRQRAVADRADGRVRVVRGGKSLARGRHQLEAAGVSEQEWRERWEAARWFLTADGETGKRHGNETLRITPDGQVSIKLPAPLAEFANAPHGRYVLSARVSFAFRGEEWVDRVEADRAVAYRIHLDAVRGRWYVDASWQRPPVQAIPLEAALTAGVVGVDTNADHLAGWQLDARGNPVGRPRRFFYDLSGSASHRDAQLRHALTRLLHWTRHLGVTAIAIEDLDFGDVKSREKHGRRRLRRVVHGIPTGRLKARLVSMAAECGIALVAVDAAYTSRWGAEHWQQATSTRKIKTSRHEAASLVIGRRAQGHGARRRTAPPPHHRSDDAGHRTAQARHHDPGREEPRPARTGGRTRSAALPSV
ncbi:IS605 OrfB family transposase [Actinocorallia herbida]|uniref:IS605 OrfB family transposase n=1 Tax=Actinocorallia herbida TaxID=58109 RepID=A0A3N1CUH2_9ACTN|nr:transposase [Actinocorallia herbida]ROO84961.1 IS605 OrfB family transposase [Actinocorallia herbida]